MAENEELVDGALRAAQDLDESYLFVQGPPGTGKTYTIANVILSLLGDGLEWASPPTPIKPSIMFWKMWRSAQAQQDNGLPA